MESSTLSKSMRGSMMHIGVSMITIIFGFLRTVLLMRWLADPDAFGTITLALFFSNLTIPFATFGVDSALIQEKDPPPTAYSTNFVLRIAFSIGILLICILFTPALRFVYPEQVIQIIWLMLGLNILEATYSTHTIILRREMRFGALAIINLIASLAISITAPLLAYLGCGIWSLIAEKVVGSLTRWISLWLFVRPWRLTVIFDRKQAQRQIRFGSQIVLSNTLGILLDRFDDFWTGTFLGQTELGYYSRAYDIAQYPERILATPITNVFFSTYSAVQDNNKELTHAFWLTSSFLVRAGLLLSLLLFASTQELTVLLFGETWLPIVPVFRLMLIYIILDPIYVNLSYLMISLGLPNLLNRARVIQVLFFILAVILFSHFWGINGVAWAANLMMITGTLFLFIYSKRKVQISILKLFGWPICAAASAGLAVMFLSGVLKLTDQSWTGFLTKSLTIFLVYTVFLVILEKEMLRETIQFIRNQSNGTTAKQN
jgi:lipopolysaccharide exporter